MRWENIFEAICAAPSVILEQITNGWSAFWAEERLLAQEGEYVEESMDREEDDRAE